MAKRAYPSMPASYPVVRKGRNLGSFKNLFISLPMAQASRQIRNIIRVRMILSVEYLIVANALSITAGRQIFTATFFKAPMPSLEIRDILLHMTPAPNISITGRTVLKTSITGFINYSFFT